MGIPVITISLNDVDKTSIFSPAILDLTIVDVFNQELKPSQISITFSSNLSHIFYYGDKIDVTIKWDDNPATFISDSFYVDFIQDNKPADSETFEISGVGHLTTYAINVNASNDRGVQTVQTMMNSFISSLSITDAVYTDFDGNINTIILGTKDSPSDVTSFKGGSALDFIEKICKLLGCVAKVTPGKLRMYRITDLVFEVANVGIINNTSACLGISKNPKATSFASSYTTNYQSSLNNAPVNEQDWTWVVSTVTLNKNIAGNNKIWNTNSPTSGVFTNSTTATYINAGAYANHYFEAFLTDFNFVGIPQLKAGLIFSLGTPFNEFNESYFMSEVVHKVNANGWLTDVKCYPVNEQPTTRFKSTLLFSPSTTVIDPNQYGGRILTPPTNNLVIGKTLDLGSYDVAGKRYTDLTLDRVIGWIMGEKDYYQGIRSHTETQVREVIEPAFNDAVTNNIRKDIAIAVAMELCGYFTEPRRTTTRNPFKLFSAVSGGTEQTFTQFSHCGNALAQRLVRVGTNRGYVGTPRDAQIVNFTQNGSPTINNLNTAFKSTLSPSFVRDTLVRMYTRIGLGTNVSVEL